MAGPQAAGSPGRTLLGAPTVFQFERWLDRPLRPDDFPRVVASIARIAHRRGQSQVVDEVLRWQNTSDVEQVTLAVTPDQGRTRIHLVARYGGLAALVYFAAFFACLFLTAAFGGFVLGVRTLAGALALMPAGVVVAYLVGRGTWGGLARRRQQELAALVEALARPETGDRREMTV